MTDVKMKALRKFRRTVGDALLWVEPNEQFTVSEQSVAFLVSTKRAKRVIKVKDTK